MSFTPPANHTSMVPSAHGQRLMMAEKIRESVPNVYLGLELWKVQVNELGWSKLREILGTAHETTEAIVNMDSVKKRDNENARNIWRDLVTDMDWDKDCLESIFIVSGENGKIVKSVKSGPVKVNIEDLNDQTPILFDSDWFQLLDQITGSEDRKRKAHEITWMGESEQKKHEIETPENVNRVPLAQEMNQRIEPEHESESGSTSAREQELLLELEDQRLKGEERIMEVTESYEKRIVALREMQEQLADDYDRAGESDKKRIEELQQQVQLQKHEQVIKNNELNQLQTQVEQFQSEKDEFNKQFAEMRESIQTLKEEKVMKQEASASRIDDWSMESSEDDQPKHNFSTPNKLKGSRKRIMGVSKSTNVPGTLSKLGMSVYNPLKNDKVEYLAKFLAMTRDYTEEGDFKFIKQLLFQAFADDKEFRIQELTEDDLKDQESLFQAIIKQEYGDSVDLMKTFEQLQIKRGECHRSYYYRVINLYQIANSLTDAKDSSNKTWKEYHSHALKIYFKIEDSLPSGPKAKFIELMMDSRTKNAMTVPVINANLETILRIYKEDLKKTLGSQKHVLPEIDAIKSRNNKSQYQKSNDNERKCWICNKPGHQKKDCPDRFNKRETKTKSGSRDKPMQCYKCTGLGHFAKQCPNRYSVSSREHSKWTDKK